MNAAATSRCSAKQKLNFFYAAITFNPTRILGGAACHRQMPRRRKANVIECLEPRPFDGTAGHSPVHEPALQLG